ncbi:hypothetical protein L0156_12480, partial [bacterium]|nr:hypothetical protein [bacterium]
MNIREFVVVKIHDGLRFDGAFESTQDRIIVHRKSPHGIFSKWFNIPHSDVKECRISGYEMYLCSSAESFEVQFSPEAKPKFEELRRRLIRSEEAFEESTLHTAPQFSKTQLKNKEEAPSAESVIKKSKFVKVILVLSIAYGAFIFFALTPRSRIYTKGGPVTIDNAVCDLQGCNKPAECIRYNVNQRTGEQF